MVDAVAISASIVVGVVLLAAGAAKVATRERWAVDASALGAPAWSVPVVPWFELGLGAALVAQIARRPLAIVAAACFVAFSALIARAVRRGDRPACACFGAWSTRPIGGRDLARNAALVVISMLATL